MIKLFEPHVSFRAVWNVLKVLSGTQLAEGPMVKRFEAAFARFYKIPPQACVAVNSGTSALELAYDLAGIGKDDEVIVPVLTCTATNIPLARRGAKIVFADINKMLLLDPDDLQKRITANTKAIVYVDFGGATLTLPAVMKIAKERKITVIQDSAQSVSPFFLPLADYVCVSFQAIKTLTTGDGGMLIVNNDGDVEKARRLRWFGIDRPRKQQLGDVDIAEAGYKFHMNDISAAIGLGNLKSMNAVFKRMAKVAHLYRTSGLPILTYPWLAVLIHEDAMEIKKYLEGYGIESGQHHYRNDKYTLFGDLRKDLPVMDEMESKYLLLPYHPGMTRFKAAVVCGAIRRYLLHARETS